MEVISLNVGRPAQIRYGDRTVVSGIRKSPVTEPIMLRRLNLEGDGQADLRVHGGVDKAIFAMSREAYDWWRTTGGHDVTLGTLGENLSVRGLNERDIGIGDIFSFGEALLEVSQPRFPCAKLVAVLADPQAGKKMIESKMPGVYFRVLREGLVRAGAELVCEKREPCRLSVLALFQGYLAKKIDPATASAALAIKSLTPMWRAFLEDQARPD